MFCPCCLSEALAAGENCGQASNPAEGGGRGTSMSIGGRAVTEARAPGRSQRVSQMSMGGALAGHQRAVSRRQMMCKIVCE